MELKKEHVVGLEKWIGEVSRRMGDGLLRLERRIDRVEQRLEERMDRRFAVQDERIDRSRFRR